MRNLPPHDAFDDWDGRLYARENRYLHSNHRKFLPRNVALVADDLDVYGDWRHDPHYGAIWRPHVRRAGWRPYHEGVHATTDRLALPRVPVLAADQPVPTTLADTHDWLRMLLTESHARLDDTGRGKPEGVVVRTADRARIAKIRFEDYERTAKAATRR